MVQRNLEKKLDYSLIKKSLKGDEKSLEVIIQKYLKSIYNFVLRWIGDFQAAEDVTQEVFVKVWQNLRKFDQNKNFKTWIFSIAKNSCIDFLRKKKSILFSELEKSEKKSEKNSFSESLIDSHSSPLNEMEKKEAEKNFEILFKKMPPEYKMILFLRYNDHLKFKEIAEVLEKPLNTVKSYHQRAIKILKKYLKVEENN